MRQNIEDFPFDFVALRSLYSWKMYLAYIWDVSIFSYD